MLANAMESVEDIPASSILQGLSWDWETYGQYLDAIDEVPKGINTGGYVGDVAIRPYVAGDAACERDLSLRPSNSPKWPQVDEAIRSGAFGYSISRSLFHRVPDGRNVPGTWSDPPSSSPSPPPGRTWQGRARKPRYNLENQPGTRGRGTGVDGRDQPIPGPTVQLQPATDP
ncbi:MAG: hypothetical protein IPQ14_14580 [Candidatus Microthrix sp.]|uniref:hypothetical protein n=1 Tax=Candidatus Neomicrothrix sp. TaxID=2719034 RepID=UPI0025BF4DAE|nr:hypothetical protein [Candidatus Microthrix sp.]MBL0205504.1 hypothetical protein [Candidatus Microthrix sp.]